MSRISLKARLAFVGLLTVALGSPGHADVKATYAGEGRVSMVVEVADDGSTRIEMNSGGRLESGYILIRDGKAYQVDPGAGGPVATSVEAQDYLFQEAVKRGEIIFSSDRTKKKNRAPLSVKAGEDVRVAGFSGTRYALVGSDAPGLVLSDDPRLKPLGNALGYLVTQDGKQGPGDEALAAFGPLLANRGVLSFFGQELGQIGFDTIDPARFVLPANVVTLADVQEDRADIKRPRPEERAAAIIRGAYRNGILYLLDAAGSMQVWDAGAPQGTAYAAPGQVSSFCLTGNTLWAVTLDRKAAVARLWSRDSSPEGGAGGDRPWLKVGEFPQSEKELVLALDCSGVEPVLLSTAHMTMPASGRRVDISGPTLSTGGYVVTQVQGGTLWLGINAGEWGGGLKRIALADGKVEMPADVDPKNLCGGSLNPACDPVTGLAPDPARADCMLATIGLVHMLSHGGVIRVCGQSVSPVYAKPYTLNPDWHWDGNIDREKMSSVAFHSMAADPSRAAAWAVASDGVYRFTSALLPEFFPFPKGRRRAAVDWSHPEFVLISTNMNQRHSLSGRSLILIPR